MSTVAYGAAMAVLLVGVALGAWRSAAWNRGSRQDFAMLRRLMAAEAADAPAEDQADLPEPVARYFSWALAPGQPHIRHARFEQRGELATKPDAWVPFTAVEEFTVWPPGFVWDARVRMAPLVTVRIRDSYMQGRGAMRGAVAGVIPTPPAEFSPLTITRSARSSGLQVAR